jgi:hypothetical protein
LLSKHDHGKYIDDDDNMSLTLSKINMYLKNLLKEKEKDDKQSTVSNVVDTVIDIAKVLKDV